jgi:hypothetical protein
MIGTAARDYQFASESAKEAKAWQEAIGAQIGKQAAAAAAEGQ